MKKQTSLIFGKDDSCIISSFESDSKNIIDFKNFMKSYGQIPLIEIDENNDAFVFQNKQGFIFACTVWENFFKS